MTVLLVSANPLFRETLTVTLRHTGVRVVHAEPANAEDSIQRAVPDAVLLDTALPPDILARILYLATVLRCSRFILVNPACNEMTQLDLHATTVARVDDLISAVQAGDSTANAIRARLSGPGPPESED